MYLRDSKCSIIFYVNLTIQKFIRVGCDHKKTDVSFHFEYINVNILYLC